MRPLRSARTIAVLTIAASTSVSAQPAYLVADLGDEVLQDVASYLLPTAVEPLNGIGYFLQDDGIHGAELWRTDGTALGTYMVRDLCPGLCGSRLPWSYNNLKAIGNVLYFAANDGPHGVELWISDGTALGTQLVRDIKLGPGSSAPGLFTAAAGLLYFIAEDGVHGRELWRSDGTPKGTFLVADLIPGKESSDIRSIADGFGKLYLARLSSGIEGSLWVSDGTAPGTLQISTVKTYATDIHKGNPFVVLPDGRLLFSGYTETSPNWNTELWISDGTAEGTLQLLDLNGDPEGSEPASFVLHGNEVFMTARSATVPWNRTLWRSDGTVDGTVPIPSPPDLGIRAELGMHAIVDDTLFFGAESLTEGLELYKMTNDVVSLVKDIRPGPEHSLEPVENYPYPNHVLFANLDGRLVFLANDGVEGLEFWSSDGTEEGTSRISSISPGNNAPFFDPRISLVQPPKLGSKLIVREYRSDLGYRLWGIGTSTSSTNPIKFVGTATSSYVPAKTSQPFFDFPGPRCAEAAASRLVFQTLEGSDYSLRAWGTDGSAAGTQLLADPLVSASSYGSMECHPIGDRVLLIARGEDGSALLASNGFADGTESIADLSTPGAYGETSPLFLDFEESVVFGIEGRLWTTDGSESGTTVIEELPEFQPVGISSSSSGYLLLQDLELSRTNGELGSLELVADLNGIEPSYPSDVAELASETLLFAASEAATGTELWRTDGTPEGTSFLKDIQPGVDGGLADKSDFLIPVSRISRILSVGSNAVMPADDGVHGTELWASDGTPLGTALLKDIYPGDYPSTPRNLTRLGDRVFFTAESELEGLELWVTDGTYPGTVLVKDIAPGGASSIPDDLVVRDGVLYFSAWSPNYGREAWKSDGTSAGTVRITDIAPGPKSSSPQRFARAGNRLYFSATDHVHGYELWAISDDGSIPLFLDGFESGGTGRWFDSEP